MRRVLTSLATAGIIALTSALIFSLPSRGQLGMTGVGQGGFGSGGFSLCSGTHFTMDTPNNPTFWQPPANSTTATGILDPTGGTGAFKLTATPTNVAFIDYVLNGVAGTIAPVANTVYAVEGYVKTQAFNAWATFGGFNNNGTDGFFQVGFDLVNGTVSGPTSGNTGTITCYQIEPAANGYFHISFAGSFGTGAITSPFFRFYINNTGDSGFVASTVANSVSIYNLGL